MTRMQYNTLIARFQLTRLSSKEQKKKVILMRFFLLTVLIFRSEMVLCID